MFVTKLDKNPGIPGKPSIIGNEVDYLSIVEQRAKTRLGIRPGDVFNIFSPPSRKFIDMSMRLNSLMDESSKFVYGKERELSQLATDVFMSLYQDIVERYDIIVDIKIKNEQTRISDDDQNLPTPMREIKDQDVLMEIHKRKIANLVMQGEAKNTKHIFNMPEVKEGLYRIYGNDQGERAFSVFKEITEIADNMDWLVDVIIRQQMMERDPERVNAAGNVKIDWVKKNNLEEENDQDVEYEEEEEVYSLSPKITAVGIDFPMLLHESVKGLYEILALGGIPEDQELAEKVLSNTGRMDEPEDWRWGPEIAADFRDFINENKNIDKYPNIREEVFKLMFDKETMKTVELLELVRGILSKTPKARKTIDSLVDDVILYLDNYYSYKKELDNYEKELEEYERDIKNYNSYKVDLVKDSTKRVDEKIDYSKLSRSQLQSIIDKALDSCDYKTLQEASAYI